MSFFTSFFSNPAFCNFEAPRYLFFSSNVPPLVYYSHLPIALISLFIGFFLLYKNKKALPNQILFILTLAFSAWVFLDSIFWASNRSDVIMFVWSLQILFEPLVYICALYLLDILINKQDISFRKKSFITLLYLPIILLVPTALTLSGFNISTCLSEEGPVALYYTYGIEIFYTLWLVIFSVKEYVKAGAKEKKQEIMYMSIGILFLLISFASGNIISSVTENWNYAQIGLFAMPVFISFLMYSIVKFKTFNTKLFGSAVLVVAQILLTASLMFAEDIHSFRIVTAATFLLTIFFGITLIRSIIEDIKKEEHIAELNNARSEFLNVASHQLRTPVSLITGTLSEFLEGDFDAAPPEEKKRAIEAMFHKAKKLTNVVNGILAASHMDNFEDFTLPNLVSSKTIDVRALTKDICELLKEKAEAKGLVLDYNSITASNVPIKVTSCDNYLEQAITNLIDNAINYTNKGFVRVMLTTEKNKMILQVADSGIGITAEDASRLFGKFERGTKAKDAYTDGSGLGLFVARKVILAHAQGKLSFRSDGEGKGTTFTIEINTI